MGTRQNPLTPYRKGLAAGDAYIAARLAYIDAGGHKSGQPSPSLPSNPYCARTQRRAHLSFAEGVRRSRESAEANRRNGGKPPSWGL